LESYDERHTEKNYGVQLIPLPYRYFRKTRQLYAAQGHEEESLRYLAFAERVEDEGGEEGLR